MTSISIAEVTGIGGVPIKNQVLDDQTDANEKAGRVLAIVNNPISEIRLTLPANYSGAFDIVPSIGWYEWGIANSSLKRALALNGKKLVCRQVENRIDVRAGTIQTSVILEPEALGADGIPGNYPTSYPTTTNPPAPAWTAPETPLTAEAPVELFVGTVSGISVCPLTGSTALLVISDAADSFKLKALVLTVTAGVLTKGATNTVISTTAGGFQIVQADTDKALLIYEDTADSSKCKARVLSVSGETVTPGTAEELTTGLAGVGVVARFGTSSNFVACYNESGGQAVILAVSGTGVTAFTPAGFDPLNLVGADLFILGVTSHLSNEAVVVFSSTSDNSVYASVLSNAGGTLTPGDVVSLGITNTSAVGAIHRVAAVTGDKVAFTHYDSAFYIRTLFISGDAITLNAAAAGGWAAAKVSTAYVLAAWPTLDVDDPGQVDVFEIDGSSTTSTGNQVEFEAGAIDIADVCYLSDGAAVIVYRLDSNSDAYGVVVVGGPL